MELEEDMINFDIRALETAESMQGIEALQQAIWPGSLADIVPLHVLITAAHNCGLVLGAYQQERMIGMLFGFAGLFKSLGGFKPKHCSHMLGVLPEFRNSGVGFALKCFQRNVVLSQGIDLVTWTYDPLLSRNAWLNINRLGAICKTYKRSEYGKMKDGLNAKVDSDRFQVDWWLGSKHVITALESKATERPKFSEQLNQSECLPAEKKMRPANRLPIFNQSNLLVEIPPDFQALKSTDLTLAKDWRAASREIFELAFNLNWIVKGFLFEQGRSFYLLSPGEV